MAVGNDDSPDIWQRLYPKGKAGRELPGYANVEPRDPHIPEIMLPEFSFSLLEL